MTRRTMLASCLVGSSCLALSQQVPTLPQNNPPTTIPAPATSTPHNAPQNLPVTPELPAPTIHSLPPAVQINENQLLKVIHAKEQHMSGSHLEATGDVTMTYKGYTMVAPKIVGDTRTQVFTLMGGARAVGEGTFVEGDTVTIDYRSRTYHYENGEAVIPPSKLRGQVTGNAYIKAREGSGNDKGDKSLGSTFTTCDLDHPHYLFDAKDSQVVADKYVKLHDVKFQIFGHTLFQVPYIYIPLREDASRLVPEVGQSPDEGYYIKTKYFTPVKGDDLLITKLDVLQKLGEGFGADYKYATTRASGVVSAYGLIGDQRTLTASVDHQQKIGDGNLSLDGTYQRNNYLTAPDSVFLSTRGQYSLATRNGSTRLGYQRGSSSTSGFSSVNQNIQLGQTNQWNPLLSSSLDLNYTNNESDSIGVGANRSQRMDVHLQASDNAPAVKADFDYQRAVPIGTTDNFSSGTDRTPQLTLTSDLSKLTNGKQPAEKLGLKLEAGDISDSVNGAIGRYDFEGTSRWASTQGRLQFNSGGRFNQGLYSDDTAQYTLAYDGHLAYNYGGASTFGIGYNRQRQFGYTPLATDLTGRNDLFNLEWTHAPNDATRLTLSTGYDVEQASAGGSPWQSVSLNGVFTRNIDTRLQASVLYDTFNQVWSSAALNGTWKLGSSKWAGAVRYDGSRAQFAGANLQVRGLEKGKISADAFVGYNGYTQQVEAQQYHLAYSLHCWEAVLELTDTQVGFRPGRTISFLIRIKALPFTDNFGVGTRGQSLFGSGSANY